MIPRYSAWNEYGDENEEEAVYDNASEVAIDVADFPGNDEVEEEDVSSPSASSAPTRRRRKKKKRKRRRQPSPSPPPSTVSLYASPESDEDEDIDPAQLMRERQALIEQRLGEERTQKMHLLYTMDIMRQNYGTQYSRLYTVQDTLEDIETEFFRSQQFIHIENAIHGLDKMVKGLSVGIELGFNYLRPFGLSIEGYAHAVAQEGDKFAETYAQIYAKYGHYVRVENPVASLALQLGSVGLKCVQRGNGNGNRRIYVAPDSDSDSDSEEARAPRQPVLGTPPAPRPAPRYPSGPQLYAETSS